MKKRLFSLALAFALCLGLTAPASAAGQTKISSTTRHCAFIDANGDLWMWGKNENGQLGNNSKESTTTPVKIMSGVASVSLGGSMSAAVKTDGTLWIWGRVSHIVGYDSDLFREEGNPYPVDYVKYPVKLTDNVDSVSLGEFGLAAIKKDRSLWIWGDHHLHSDLSGTGKGVKIMDDVSAVSAGSDHYAAIKTDGSLWMWGLNTYGQLGNGEAWTIVDDEEYMPPIVDTPFKLMDHVSAVECGTDFTAAIKTDGTLWLWGLNKGPYTNGRLGRAIKANHRVTVPVLGGTFTYVMQTIPAKAGGGIKDVAVTYGSVIQLLGGGVVIQNSGSYQPAGVLEIYMTDVVDIDNSVAIKKDGTVWAWGEPVGGLGMGQAVQLTGLTAGASTPGQVPSTPENTNDTGKFTDVRSTDYYADAVQWAVENKITSGTSKTTFSPGVTCNRAQILSFLWRASGSPEPTAANPFSDIKTTDYFYKAALWAAEKGMVSGSSFGASTPCTRASTVEYMWKAAGSPKASYDGKFSDVTAGSDYAQAVAWALENGVTSGTSKTTFGPDSTCTRGQIVTFLYRAFAK